MSILGYIKFVDSDIWKLLPNLPELKEFLNYILITPSIFWALGLTLAIKFFSEKDSTLDLKPLVENDTKVKPAIEKDVQVTTPVLDGESIGTTTPDSGDQLIYLEPTPEAKKSVVKIILDDVKDLLNWIGTKIADIFELEAKFREFLWVAVLESAYFCVVAYTLGLHAYVVQFYYDLSFVFFVRGVELKFFTDILFDFFSHVWIFVFFSSLLAGEFKIFTVWLKLLTRKILDSTLRLRQILWAVIVECIYLFLVACALGFYFYFQELYYLNFSFSMDINIVFEFFARFFIYVLICSLFLREIKERYSWMASIGRNFFGCSFNLQEFVYINLKFLVRELIYLYMIFIAIDSWHSAYIKCICLYLELYYFKVSTLLALSESDPLFFYNVFIEIFGRLGCVFIFGGFFITTFLLVVCLLLCRYHTKRLLKLFKRFFNNK
jgi:hypothetical protein